ncbi:MAG: hypothetical protein HYU41_23290 [Candidatus Rokubacteria bacterium]|nr:hypothetical protein [Candidatus Rokubacteria bacterium]
MRRFTLGVVICSLLSALVLAPIGPAAAQSCGSAYPGAIGDGTLCRVRVTPDVCRTLNGGSYNHEQGQCYFRNPRTGGSSGGGTGGGFSPGSLGRGSTSLDKAVTGMQIGVGVLNLLKGLTGSGGSDRSSERQRLFRLGYDANELGRSHHAAGQYKEALEAFEEAAQYHRRAGDGDNAAISDRNAEKARAGLKEREEEAHDERVARDRLADAESKYGSPDPFARGNPFTRLQDRVARADDRASMAGEHVSDAGGAGDACPARPTTRQQISECYRQFSKGHLDTALNCAQKARDMASLGHTPSGSTSGSFGQQPAFVACAELNARAADYTQCVSSGILQPGAQYNPLVKACAEKTGFVGGSAPSGAAAPAGVSMPPQAPPDAPPHPKGLDRSPSTITDRSTSGSGGGGGHQPTRDAR